MKKLKLIKKRTQNVPEKADLRGLGHEAFFKHFLPHTVLSCHQHQSLESAQPIISKFEAEAIESHKLNGVTHIHIPDNRQWDHKQEAVQLFGLALALAHVDSFHAKLNLWTTPTFSKTLQHVTHDKHVPQHWDIDELIPENGISFSEYLCIDELAGLSLKHAGFSLESTLHGHHHFSKKDLVSISKSTLKTANQRRKTG